MSHFNGDLGTWAVSNYDIPDLLIPPAVTQAPTSTSFNSLSFPPIEAHPQAHSLPTSGRMSEASVQIESGHATARSADSASSEDGPASGSEAVKSKRTGTSRYTTELKLAKNREAQRRFRLKQKVSVRCDR